MKRWQPLATEGYVDAEGRFQVTAVFMVDKSADPNCGFFIETQDDAKPPLTWISVTVAPEVDVTRNTHVFEGAYCYRIVGRRSDGKVFSNVFGVSAILVDTSPSAERIVADAMERARLTFDAYLEVV